MHIAIIAAPKSASTFVYQVLARLTKFDPIGALQSTDGRTLAAEANLQLAETMATGTKSFIFREHLLPNLNTQVFLARAGARPIVLTRNFEDTIVSLAEEWERQWRPHLDYIMATGHHLQFCGPIPATFIRRFLDANETERLDQTIGAAMPWLCMFVSGWSCAIALNPNFGLMLNYETIANDPSDALRRICDHLSSDSDLRANDEEISTAIHSVMMDPAISNFNVGINGRGHAKLNPRQLQQIAKLKQEFL